MKRALLVFGLITCTAPAALAHEIGKTQVVVVMPLAFSASGGRSQIQVEGFAEFF